MVCISVRIGGGLEPLVEFLDRHDADLCKFHDSVRESTRSKLMQTKKPLHPRQTAQSTKLDAPQRSRTQSPSPVGDEEKRKLTSFSECYMYAAT